MRDDSGNPTAPDKARDVPYGSWASPITAGLIAEAGIGLGALLAAGDVLFWTEVRPLEGGRGVVVRRDPGGAIDDVTPDGFNARTLVHEYGGGAYAVHRAAAGIVVVFSNFEDQRLYRQDLPADGSTGGRGAASPPRPITPVPPVPRALRYADARVTPDGAHVICVRERHADGEVVNDLVAVPADGAGEPRVLASGHDFYAAPRISPDGTRLAWLDLGRPGHAVGRDGPLGRRPDGRRRARRGAARGRRPRRVRPAARLEPGRAPALRERPQRLVEPLPHRRRGRGGARRPGGRAASPCRPRRSPRWTRSSPSRAWVFGLQDYVFLPDGRLLAYWSAGDADRLGVITADPGAAAASTLAPIPCAFTAFGSIAALAGGVAVLGGSPSQGATIALLDAASGDLQEVRRASSAQVDPGYISAPEPIEFPTSYEPGSVTGPLLDELAAAGGSLSAHALYYPPANKDAAAPAGEKPPLIVISHGGPTSAAEAVLTLGIQYWTSRGIAVVDVNYGGSTGHGRAYRERLKGNWGIVDTVDCINAARFLVERGDVDPARLAIRGGSAGGYTTLNALTRHRFFTAGASLFGLADLEAFVSGGTHKFEAQYLLGLVGPYPEMADVYRERSPIHHVDDISCPVIVLQGLEDAIVPPAQAELIVGALRRKGLPYAYLPFEGEQHGFRKAESIVRSLEAELYFYGKVFGFAPADGITPVEIENL